MSHWSGVERAPKTKFTACQLCKTQVESFDTSYGRPVRLDVTPVSVTVDIEHPDVRERLWEYRGPRVGWCHLFVPRRTWREIRTEHRCDQQREHESKRKNERNTR